MTIHLEFRRAKRSRVLERGDFAIADDDDEITTAASKMAKRCGVAKGEGEVDISGGRRRRTLTV